MNPIENLCFSNPIEPKYFNLQTQDGSRPHYRHFSANDMMVKPPMYIQQESLDEKQRKLRFHVVLEAATAVTQRAEESSITYLNRGQLYCIQLTDTYNQNETITSSLSIEFHNASHRSIAENYWNYWLAQQKQLESRAIDIDLSQSVGIVNAIMPSFDKISFEWNGSIGAKLCVRFKCLSTDFSRIKGVKGIPLRAHMESKTENEQEACYCKIKLFRDKGAERKNKDDAKQISKQLEKVYGSANPQSLSLLYKESSPYTVFSETLQENTRYHTRTMTAPNATTLQPIFPMDMSFVPMTTSTPLLYIPPLIEEENESLYTPLQSTPTDAFSIYDVFTPQEIQHDYFSQQLSLAQDTPQTCQYGFF
ncbi:hypothetical protein RMCBS344292_10354 [Rhizopus microsporus]|nr:hypothetical protein RMCBS344292_10354 [Rhizopus microsporus]